MDLDNNTNVSRLPAICIKDFLKTIELFSQVDDKTLMVVADKCKSMHLTKGKTLFRKGDVISFVYFVYSGYIAEYVGTGAGVDIVVAVRGKGYYMGEMAAIASVPQATTVSATERTTIVAMPKEIFLSALWENPSMMKSTIYELMNRLLKASNYAVSSINLDAPSRVAYNIIKLMPKGATDKFQIYFTQSDLASAAGVSRQTVATILHDWREMGIISTERGKLLVHDIKALSKLSEGEEL